MDFKQIEAFISVAKLKSFSKAANSIYLSQPTISSHISSLEKELNIQLFDRTSKEVNLTPAGRMFLNYASDIINTKNTAVSVLGSFENNITGKLSLSASTTPCNTLVPKLIKKFHEIYPHIKYEVKEQGSSDIIKDILNLDCEIGLIGTKVKDDKLHCFSLKEDELVLISHPDMKLPKEISLNKLMQLNLVVRDSNSATRKTFEKELTRHDMLPSRLNVICEANNLDTLIQCVKANIGVAIVSKSVCKDYIKFNMLSESTIINFDLKRNIYLIVNSKRTLTPTANAFLELCREEFSSK
ncbi:selenium metabolism-associated LysR family transcriptional regulator [Clostridium polynesiense]|uniref:selenium metabolism-associated LysR family transcriptional regulator n=1 Tax=Clostridium polynesiense TaxID=1325933 RepID=UPI00058CAD39|nr:selenium metabolism-associated LysR family transcriptional regulator [Clostridium polynesiense]